MAYQINDDLWNPSTQIDDKSKIDFYSQLKKRFNYLETGVFFSIQGINIPEFSALENKQSNGKKSEDGDLDKKSGCSILTYTYKNIDQNTLRLDTKDFTNEKFLDVDDSLFCYLRQQKDKEEFEKFCDKYKIKISPEFQKILIELGIKNWMRQSLADKNIGLQITLQLFPEKQFFTIYVRSPKDKESKAVAVEFLYKDGCIYIQNIMCDLKQIKRRFRFLRQRKNSEKLINNQQYFVDESEKLYISCYTSDFFTPTLIGRNGILEEMEKGTLEINRTIEAEHSSKLLPLVSYYNSKIKPIKRIKNMICIDSHNQEFIQYFVPSAKNIDNKIKKGFRVYHLIGKTYSGESIPTSKLIEHPLTNLHFSTLTHDILKISDNSQLSLLQKVAKVLIEN